MKLVKIFSNSIQFRTNQEESVGEDDFLGQAAGIKTIECSIFGSIKEGRKFGITLFPATQRPSELNKTIIAQCANMIIGKLNNENDKALIKMQRDASGGGRSYH